MYDFSLEALALLHPALSEGLQYHDSTSAAYPRSWRPGDVCDAAAFDKLRGSACAGRCTLNIFCCNCSCKQNQAGLAGVAAGFLMSQPAHAGVIGTFADVDPDEEWNQRLRGTGAAGRLVAYDSGDRPQDDLHLRGGAGKRVVVSFVRRSSRAEQAGVKTGDMLVSINGRKAGHCIIVRKLFAFPCQVV
eukprot:Skav221030  [mRNA]  locus=scaffold576:188113:195903:- [translate_table: standard]